MGGRADDVRVIAHRGFAGRYPENTVAAVEAAVRGGWDSSDGDSERHAPAPMVEVDVLPTADGTPVVFHDDDLGGLTDRSGLVWETGTDIVTGATVLATDETVPTLAEVLAAVPDSVSVNVELKIPDGDARAVGSAAEPAERIARWRPFIDRVLGVVDDQATEVLVSSFSEAAVATVRELAPTIPVAFLFGTDAEAGLEVTRTYDCEAMHVPTDLVAGTAFVDDSVEVDLVDLARKEGRQLNVWTVETWYQARQLAEAGVDGIIADYPGLLTVES